MHTGVMNRENVGMIQRRQRLGLLLESPKPIRIAGEILRQHLDRHVAIESRVPRTKHFSHPASANAAGDSVLLDRDADHGSPEMRCALETGFTETWYPFPAAVTS